MQQQHKRNYIMFNYQKIYDILMQPQQTRECSMFNYQKIYDILKTSTPTNGELAKIIYGSDTLQYRVNIRNLIGIVRHKFKVQITANEYGQYHMVRPHYQYQDSQLNYEGKRGRPRKFA